MAIAECGKRLMWLEIFFDSKYNQLPVSVAKYISLSVGNLKQYILLQHLDRGRVVGFLCYFVFYTSAI